MSIAPEGWPFILGAAALAFLLVLLRLPVPAVIAVVLTLFVTWFFRDPHREIPGGDGVIVSPADGKVIEITPQPDGGVKIAIFLNIFDVHVNRVPYEGVVENVSYHPGRFLAAWKTIASDENERSVLTLSTPLGEMRVSQVAGLVARRIVCRVREGARLGRGERFGLIRFGSRVDTWLPPGVEAAVSLGDRVRGGADVIARAAPQSGERP